MTKTLLLISFTTLYLTNYAQLKVTPKGNIGIKTNDPNSALQVNGDVTVTGNNNTLKLTANDPGVKIGSSTDRIEFWYEGVGHNWVYAQKFKKVSDSTLKADIEPLSYGLDDLMALNTYEYNTSSGAENSSIEKEFGFISQEVENQFPDMVSESKGYKLMDYDQIIPLAVKSIQEQQALINFQKNEIDSLYNLALNQNEKLELFEHKLNLVESKFISNETSGLKYSEGKLKIELFEGVNESVSLKMFNDSGEVIKTISVNNKDSFVLTENVYKCILLIDGVLIESLNIKY